MNKKKGLVKTKQIKNPQILQHIETIKCLTIQIKEMYKNG